MAKTSAPGMALRRFIENALCDIADGYLGARAVIDPSQRGRGSLQLVERVEVSFDLVVATDGQGKDPVRVLGKVKGDGAAASHLRFSLPLTIPLAPALPDTTGDDTEPNAEPEVDPISLREPILL